MLSESDDSDGEPSRFSPLSRGELEGCPAARGFAASLERETVGACQGENTLLRRESNRAYNILFMYIEIFDTDVLLLNASVT